MTQALISEENFAVLRSQNLCSLSVLAFASAETLVNCVGSDAGLVDLLGSNDPAAAEQAAWVLAALATRNAIQRKAVIQRAGVLPALVALLRHPSLPAEQAAKALKWLAVGEDHLRSVIADTGAIPALAALVTSSLAASHAGCALQAAAAMRNLSASPSLCVQTTVAFTPLFALLQSNAEAEAKEHVVGFLLNMAASKHFSSEVSHFAAAVLPALVAQLKDGSPGAKHLAAATLLNIAAISDEQRSAVVAAGALPPLVALMRAPSQADATWEHEGQAKAAREHAAGALRNITIAEAARDAAVAAGALPSLAALIYDPALTRLAAEHAAAALRNISSDGNTVSGGASASSSAKNDSSDSRGSTSASGSGSAAAQRREALAATGALRPLVKLLIDSSPAAKVHAAGALANATVDSSSVRQAVYDAGAVKALLNCVEIHAPAAPEAACALANMALDCKALCDVIAGGGWFEGLLEVTVASFKMTVACVLCVSLPIENHDTICAMHCALLILLLTEL